MNDIHDIFVTHEHVDHVLGIIWLVRMIGQRMNQGKYEGDLRIYCHEELAEKIQAIANMTIQQKVCKHMDERIQFDIVKDGDSRMILGCPVTFFDIASTLLRQKRNSLDSPCSLRAVRNLPVLVTSRTMR